MKIFVSHANSFSGRNFCQVLLKEKQKLLELSGDELTIFGHVEGDADFTLDGVVTINVK